MAGVLDDNTLPVADLGNDPFFYLNAGFNTRNALRILLEKTLDCGSIDGEGNILRAVAHGDIDADDLRVDIDERPAGVAGIDRRVMLDEAGHDHVIGHGDFAIQGADDPARDAS